MKKVLSAVVLALLFVIVGCTTGSKSNARAYITSIIPQSTEVSFKVEVRDPDSELDSKEVVVRLTATNQPDINQNVELSTANPSKTITIKNLQVDTAYNVYVFGLKDDKRIQLYHTTNVFTTLKQGDDAANPLSVKTTEEFLAMDYKKHYKLENDLDFEGASITPLYSSGTPFTGSFDGGNFTIKNIHITAENDVYKSYLSIFGYASRSTIKNVKFDNIKIDNEAKPYIGIHYVGIIVSKISNNSFLLENIEISNSSITINHNLNKSVTNRNLYVGLVGGSMQGTLKNIVVKDSELIVNQNALNGVYAGAQASTAGSYIGGAFGLIEQDKGLNIERIAVLDTNINIDINQDKAGIGTGILFAGGIFGAYRSDQNASQLYATTNITIHHTKHDDTEDSKLDTVYVGGIVGSMIKSRFNNALYQGDIQLNLSDKLNRVYASLIAGQATTSSINLLAGGSLDVATTTDSQTSISLSIYPYNWPNKFNEVYILVDTQILLEGVDQALDDFDVAASIAERITSEFILDLLN